MKEYKDTIKDSETLVFKVLENKLESYELRNTSLFNHLSETSSEDANLQKIKLSRDQDIKNVELL